MDYQQQQPMMQQPMYQQQPMGGPQVVYAQQPGMVVMMQDTKGYPPIWPTIPVGVTCHHCQHNGLTVVDRSMTGMGWLVCLLLWFIGCCCIACCIPSCNTYVHSCHHCKRPLGELRAGMSVTFWLMDYQINKLHVWFWFWSIYLFYVIFFESAR